MTAPETREIEIRRLSCGCDYCDREGYVASILNTEVGLNVGLCAVCLREALDVLRPEDAAPEEHTDG